MAATATTCPEILGYILIDKQNPGTGDCYVGLQDLNMFVSNHGERIKHVNNHRLEDLNREQRQPIENVLDSVKVSENFPTANKASPLNRFFEKLPKHEFVEKLFTGKKTIITTNRRVVQEIIKFGRAEAIKELKLSAAKIQLEGANFPGNILDSITVIIWDRNVKTKDFSKCDQTHGMKFKNYVTSKEVEDGAGKSSFKLFAILYLEIGSDTILLYNAEIDAAMKGSRGIETVELKLSPAVYKNNIEIKANLENAFHSRNPSSEDVRGQMPLLQGMLGRTDKLIVAYTENGNWGTVWKSVREYDFHQMGHNLLEEDVNALQFFVDEVLSIELMGRATGEDKIKWNNVLIQRCPDGHVKYYWGQMFENALTE